MLRAGLALALALAWTACSAPAPATTARDAPPAPAAPAPAKAPSPAPAARPAHPLCDAAAGPLAALRDGGARTPIAYTGTALQQWVMAGDAALGRQDDGAITASLADASPAGFEYSKALIEAALAQWMRDQLKRAGEGTEGREAAWAAARCAWEVALRGLAADVAAADPGLAEDVDRAFAAGAAALASSGPAAVDRALWPGYELVEKTWLRIAHRRLVAAMREAKRTGDPALGARARGLFEALRDRLKDRNTPGIAIVDAALAAAPDQLDPDRVEREIALALVKRARKYCDEAVTPAAKGPLGSPASLATVAEGLAYTQIVLPDMSDKLRAEGFDAAAHLQLWQAYAEAVEHADTAEAQRLSAELVQWNCAYQRALGIRECTSSADETSSLASP